MAFIANPQETVIFKDKIICYYEPSDPGSRQVGMTLNEIMDSDGVHNVGPVPPGGFILNIPQFTDIEKVKIVWSATAQARLLNLATGTYYATPMKITNWGVDNSTGNYMLYDGKQKQQVFGRKKEILWINGNLQYITFGFMFVRATLELVDVFNVGGQVNVDPAGAVHQLLLYPELKITLYRKPKETEDAA